MPTPRHFRNLQPSDCFFPFFVIINIAFLVFWFFVKKKYLLISVAGFIACAVPIRTYCPLNFPTSAPEDAIKVLTYNTLWYGQNKYDEDGKNEVIEYIKDVDADIVCLQEANSPTIRLWDMKETLEFLRTQMGRTYRTKSIFDSGVATACCAEIIEACKYALSFLPNIELTTFWIIVFTLYFGRKILFVIPAFILLEGSIYGFGLWWFMYLYAWPLLVLLTWIFRKQSPECYRKIEKIYLVLLVPLYFIKSIFSENVLQTSIVSLYGQ